MSVRNGLDMSDGALEQGDGADQFSWACLCITFGSVSGISHESHQGLTFWWQLHSFEIM